MRNHPVFLAAALAIVAGCGVYRPTPVSLAGQRDRLASLAGRWEGAYYGSDTRRAGTIAFTMRANGDSAFGEVVMRQLNEPNVAVVNGGVQRAPEPAAIPRALFISFVAVADSGVSGRLEPYTAPDCQCTVTTVFTGRQRGDTIEGKFITEGKLIVSQLGAWRVVRQH